MNTLNHITPGPWKFKPFDTIKNKNGTFTAFISQEIGFNFVKVTGSGTYGKEEAEETAKLISAAPELLDALRDILQYCVTSKGMPDKGKGRTNEQQTALDNAIRAITKAEGSS
jgi:hypothetical protein